MGAPDREALQPLGKTAGATDFGERLERRSFQTTVRKARLELYLLLTNSAGVLHL